MINISRVIALIRVAENFTIFFGSVLSYQILQETQIGLVPLIYGNLCLGDTGAVGENIGKHSPVIYRAHQRQQLEIIAQSCR